MAPFLFCVLNADGHPVPGLSVTARPPRGRGPTLAGTTGLDGYVHFWVPFNDHLPGPLRGPAQHLEAANYPSFTLDVATVTTRRSPTSNQASWTHILIDVSLDTLVSYCVLLRLRPSSSYMVQYLATPCVPTTTDSREESRKHPESATEYISGNTLDGQP